MGKFIVKDGQGFERIVFGEVLIPDTVNVYGDFHTKESIRDFAYGFMLRGFGLDIDHDNIDVTGSKVSIVESFIARDGDPDFTPGSWVLGSYISDDALWQGVLDGVINGYSYEALISQMEVDIHVSDSRLVYGDTEPDPVDKHVHRYFVILDEDGRPISGGTTYTNQHNHSITFHTVTDESFGHTHRYNLTESKEVNS